VVGAFIKKSLYGRLWKTLERATGRPPKGEYSKELERKPTRYLVWRKPAGSKYKERREGCIVERSVEADPAEATALTAGHIVLRSGEEENKKRGGGVIERGGRRGRRG